MSEQVSPLSVAEYHQLGEFNENGRRTELIRGFIIQKTSKSPFTVSLQINCDEFSKSRLPSISLSLPRIRSPPSIPSRSRT